MGRTLPALARSSESLAQTWQLSRGRGERPLGAPTCPPIADCRGQVVVVHGRPCGRRQGRRRQPGSRGGGATPRPDLDEAGLGPHAWSSWGRRVLGPRLHRGRGDGGTSREGHGLDPWLHGGLDRTVAGKVPGGGSRGRAEEEAGLWMRSCGSGEGRARRSRRRLDPDEFGEMRDSERQRGGWWAGRLAGMG